MAQLRPTPRADCNRTLNFTGFGCLPSNQWQQRPCLAWISHRRCDSPPVQPRHLCQWQRCRPPAPSQSTEKLQSVWNMMPATFHELITHVFYNWETSTLTMRKWSCVDLVLPRYVLTYWRSFPDKTVVNEHKTVLSIHSKTLCFYC